MTPDGDSETDDELRQELKDACENVRRQIDVLNRSRFSRGGGHGGDDLALAELNRTLAELEEALSSLHTEDD